jgi:Ca2+-binding RTX toxin-like protein
LLVALTAGVALAALKTGTPKADNLVGTAGDEVGQDTLIGYAGNDTLDGSSAADQLLGGEGSDKLYGRAGNDTLDGGPGKDYIYTGAGFDFVYAKDGVADYINCNNEGLYMIQFDTGLDTLDKCPSSSSAGAASADGKGASKEQNGVVLNNTP